MVSLKKPSSQKWRHPLGVYPLGNSLLDPGASSRRSSGLGNFACLSDDLLLVLLQSLPPNHCARLGCASAILHPFCGHDETWRDFCVEAVNAGAHLRWAPEGTWRATYVLSFGNADSQRPSCNRTTSVHVYSDVLCRNFLMASTELDKRWLARETLQRIDGRGLTAEEFVDLFERRSCPVILEGCCDSWAAMQSWNKDALLKRFGDVHFQCGPCELPLEQFYAYADKNTDDLPLFVFDKYFSKRAPDLLQDYEVPSVFQGRDLFDLLGESRPDCRWLLIGNKRSGSKWHIDPNKTSAWNAVVKGKKRWVLLPPGCPPPGVFPSRDGGDVTQPANLIEWFSTFYGELRKMADGNKAWDLKEGTCGPGDTVFVPCGWWHCVLNLEDDTVAVTQNYVPEAQVHSVRRFLREKPDHVSGVSGQEKKANLGRLFDAALERSRPDLLAKGAEQQALAPCIEKGNLDPSGIANTVTGNAQCVNDGFSFWGHLRSTGRSLAFDVGVGKHDAEGKLELLIQEDESVVPDAKRAKMSSDEDAADWLGSLQG